MVLARKRLSGLIQQPAVVAICKCVISSEDLEKNFSSIFCKHKRWPWQIRKLNKKDFFLDFRLGKVLKS
jgi:hypothetical protein